jgi:hypothetical protein
MIRTTKSTKIEPTKLIKQKGTESAETACFILSDETYNGTIINPRSGWDNNID